MRLEAPEFIRRFLLHVLPPSFQRIRYFGFLSNRVRKPALDKIRPLLGTPPREASQEATPLDEAEPPDWMLRICPVCKLQTLAIVGAPRAANSPRDKTIQNPRPPP